MVILIPALMYAVVAISGVCAASDLKHQAQTDHAVVSVALADHGKPDQPSKPSTDMPATQDGVAVENSDSQGRMHRAGTTDSAQF